MENDPALFPISLHKTHRQMIRKIGHAEAESALNLNFTFKPIIMTTKKTCGARVPVSVLLCGFLVALASCGWAQTTPQRTLLALSKTDHTLAIIDPASLKVIARLPVGSDPHEVIASTDGTRAYVTIYGGGSLHELDILDLVGQKALPGYDTKPLYGPHGVVFVGGKVWFTAEGSKAVGRYDPATGQTDWVMGTGQDRTHMIFVTPDGKRVYTTNVSSGTVSILVDTLVQQRMGPPPGGQQGPPPGGQQRPPAGTAPGAPAAGMPPPPGQGPRAHEDWSETVIPVSRGSEGFDVSP